MRNTRIVRNPTDFLVEDYLPGLTVDLSTPNRIDATERFRRLFLTDEVTEASSDGEIAAAVGTCLFQVGLAGSAGDFRTSLNEFAGLGTLDEQLKNSLGGIKGERAPEGRLKKIEALLDALGCMRPTTHYAVRLYCHVPGETTDLEAGSTHFGYVVDGECTVVEDGREILVRQGMYFAIGNGGQVRGTGSCEIVTRFGYHGMSHYGGYVEPWGRLQYIDGCTDTILIHPEKKGGPCYNALYFRPDTQQTRHVHPSVRCGLVISGEGVCKTPNGDHPLRKGKIFFLPPETYHSFHTGACAPGVQSALTVIAFHPDSDFGPTDEDHPMVNRTYFRFLHRLVSSAKTGPASTRSADKSPVASASHTATQPWRAARQFETLDRADG